ncbi:sulfotransferase [Rhodanobacter hydrolyticus]|uniref:Sulfotransferase n=1 Tax=Rhodanobacter hydrolyticus TaxID=2250595 RepID=A0ABW8J7R0_9GAMM
MPHDTKTPLPLHDADAQVALGKSQMRSGSLAEAAHSCRQAIALKPDHLEAHYLLGNVLGAQGRLAEAADSFRQALAIKPDFIEARARLGHTLMAIHQPGEAEAHFLQVLAARPDDANTHNSLGIVYRELARLADAETCYRCALAIKPDYAEAHNNLGNVLRDQGRRGEAESSYRQALAINDRFAEPHFNLGNILRDQQRLPEAEQSYRCALAIRPDYLMALNNLGLCLKKQGRVEEACASFEAAVAIKPDFLQSLCNLAPFRTYAVDDPQLRALEDQQHQLPSLPQAGRVNYWFALGKMREDAGRHDDAFAAYAEGNRLQRMRFPYDEAREAALVAQLKSVFHAGLFEQRPPSRRPGRTPVFIVGMPRSGTTLIEQILASHPGIHGAGELTDLHDVVHSLDTASNASVAAYPEIAATLSVEALQQLGAAYEERAWRHAPQATHITDKLPANFLHVGMIHRMLPHAKIIHAMRDPMDSCFSCYARLFEEGNLDFSYDLGSLGRYYVRYIELMRHWHRVLPAGAVLDLRYEDMVADTAGQARRLLDYLGLPWDERCLDFHRNQRVVRTASIAQVRKPIYRSSVARWKHFETHLKPLLDIVRDYR